MVLSRKIGWMSQTLYSLTLSQLLATLTLFVTIFDCLPQPPAQPKQEEERIPCRDEVWPQ